MMGIITLFYWHPSIDKLKNLKGGVHYVVRCRILWNTYSHSCP